MLNFLKILLFCKPKFLNIYNYLLHPYPTVRQPTFFFNSKEILDPPIRTSKEKLIILF